MSTVTACNTHVFNHQIRTHDSSNKSKAYQIISQPDKQKRLFQTSDHMASRLLRLLSLFPDDLVHWIRRTTLNSVIIAAEISDSICDLEDICCFQRIVLRLTFITKTSECPHQTRKLYLIIKTVSSSPSVALLSAFFVDSLDLSDKNVTRNGMSFIDCLFDFAGSGEQRPSIVSALSELFSGNRKSVAHWEEGSDADTRTAWTRRRAVIASIFDGAHFGNIFQNLLKDLYLIQVTHRPVEERGEEE